MDVVFRWASGDVDTLIKEVGSSYIVVVVRCHVTRNEMDIGE